MNRCQKGFCETQKRDFCNDLRVVNVVSVPASLMEHTVRRISNSVTEYCSHLSLSFMRPTVLDWIIEPSATRSKYKAKGKGKIKIWYPKSSSRTAALYLSSLQPFFTLTEVQNRLFLFLNYYFFHFAWWQVRFAADTLYTSGRINRTVLWRTLVAMSFSKQSSLRSKNKLMRNFAESILVDVFFFYPH